MRPFWLLGLCLSFGLPAFAQPQPKKTIHIVKEKNADTIRFLPPEPIEERAEKKYRYASKKRDLAWAKAYPDSVENLQIVLAFDCTMEGIANFNNFMRRDMPRFQNLTNLEINFTYIMDTWACTDGFFADLPKLASLPKLTEISLFNIPKNYYNARLFDALAKLPQVRTIQFSHSDISNFAGELPKLKQIDTFSFISMRLEECPDAIFKMPHIKRLEIDYTGEKMPDKRLAQAKHLTSITVMQKQESFEADKFRGAIQKMLPNTIVREAHWAND